MSTKNREFSTDEAEQRSGDQFRDDGFFEPNDDANQQYSFCPADIVTLPDKQGSEQPTRANILRQIDILVKDAKARPFHLSVRRSFDANGDRGRTEADNMEECITYFIRRRGPSSEMNLISRRSFDSVSWILYQWARISSYVCYSTSFFPSNNDLWADLEYYRCKMVYIPWVTKGAE
ncbi:hypothetical protein C8J56DRAFT_884464 [Mycena floridula]|nr:hypothetical protein C8J56DRAFT_884464 [Mycena floridula]